MRTLPTCLTSGRLVLWLAGADASSKMHPTRRQRSRVLPAGLLAHQFLAFSFWKPRISELCQRRKHVGRRNRARLWAHARFFAVQRRYNETSRLNVRSSTYKDYVGDRCLVFCYRSSRFTAFHGGNTGSNPVGDAKSFQRLGTGVAIFHRHKKAQFQACLPARFIKIINIYRVERHFCAGTKRHCRPFMKTSLPANPTHPYKSRTTSL